VLTAFSCPNGRAVRLTDSGAPNVATDAIPDATADAIKDAIWIDLLNPTNPERDLVAVATGLSIPTEAEVGEIESSSRLATRDGVLYLSMPMVSVSERMRAVSVGFVLSPDRLVTIRFADSKTFTAYADNLPTVEMQKNASAGIFVGLLEAIVDRQADVLETVGLDLESISHRIFRLGAAEAGGRKEEDAVLRQTLGQLGRLGDTISHIRDTQLAAARIVPYVELTAATWLPKDIKIRLRTLRRDISSVSDFATHLIGKLQFMLDATLGFISIAQNNLMKVMTIASVAGIPPVLVAGIYGMNFANMPELAWPYGYAFGLGMIVVTTLIPLAIFRWRKWI
jgi:magnesium transporter